MIFSLVAARVSVSMGGTGEPESMAAMEVKGGSMGVLLDRKAVVQHVGCIWGMAAAKARAAGAGTAAVYATAVPLAMAVATVTLGGSSSSRYPQKIYM